MGEKLSKPSPGALIASDDFLQLICSRTPILDVRSEGEFSKASIDSFHNEAILDNHQRALVGTCYKNQGRNAAISLGHTLVDEAAKESRLQHWTELYSDNPNLVISCARGGLRSEITQSWLAEKGISAPRIKGGYKALRTFLMSILDDAKAEQFIAVSGHTGSGKTRLLLQLHKLGLPVVDLEAIANHRGSAFGQKRDPQPAQATFENNLACAIIRAGQKSTHPIIIESESRSIGTCWLPKTFFEAVRNCSRLHLECPLETRVDNIIQDYVQDLLNRFSKEDNPFKCMQTELCSSLAKIKKRLGAKREAELQKLLLEAVEKHQSGMPPSVHRSWITRLLAEYYDPLYERHSTLNSSLIIDKGNAEHLARNLRRGAYKRR